MPGSDRPFRLGDIQVDPVLHQLSRGASSVPVEPKVMRLLLCLAAQNGQIIRHQQIRSEVWGRVHVVDGVVARAAYQLRRAIAQLESRGVEIETLRQVGYRLVVRRLPRRRSGLREYFLRQLASPRPAWLIASLSLALALHLTLLRPDYRLPPGPSAPSTQAAPARFVSTEPASAESRSPPAPVADRPIPRPRATAAAPLEQPTRKSERDLALSDEGRFFQVARLEFGTPAQLLDERRAQLQADVRARRAALVADVAARYADSNSWRPRPARSPPAAPAAPSPPAAPEPPPPDQASS